MNSPQPDSNNRKSLEREMHRVLRSVPDRAAPASLERRVFGEIARRAALPWWRQSFARWPLAARVVFMIVSAAAAAFFILGAARLLNFVPEQIEMPSILVSLGEICRAYLSAASDFAASIPRNIVALIAAGIAASWATLFGFGAAAYRYLWKTQ